MEGIIHTCYTPSKCISKGEEGVEEMKKIFPRVQSQEGEAIKRNKNPKKTNKRTVEVFPGLAVRGRNVCVLVSCQPCLSSKAGLQSKTKILS